MEDFTNGEFNFLNAYHTKFNPKDSFEQWEAKAKDTLEKGCFRDLDRAFGLSFTVFSPELDMYA